MKTYGLLQPVVVRPLEGGYVLLAGHRRVAAARSLGWESIPAIVRPATDDEAYLLTIVDNLQRQDLSPRKSRRRLKPWCASAAGVPPGSGRHQPLPGICVQATARLRRSRARSGSLAFLKAVFRALRPDGPSEFLLMTSATQRPPAAPRSDRRSATSARHHQVEPRHAQQRARPSAVEATRRQPTVKIQTLPLVAVKANSATPGSACATCRSSRAP